MDRSIFNRMDLSPGNNRIVIAEGRVYDQSCDHGKCFRKRDAHVPDATNAPIFVIINALPQQRTQKDHSITAFQESMVQSLIHNECAEVENASTCVPLAR